MQACSDRVVGQLAVGPQPHPLAVRWRALAAHRVAVDVAQVDRAGPVVPVAELVLVRRHADEPVGERLRVGEPRRHRDLVVGPLSATWKLACRLKIARRAGWPRRGGWRSCARRGAGRPRRGSAPSGRRAAGSRRAASGRVAAGSSTVRAAATRAWPATWPPNTRWRFSSGERPRKMLTSIGSSARRVTSSSRAAPRAIIGAGRGGAALGTTSLPPWLSRTGGNTHWRPRGSCRRTRVTRCTEPPSTPPRPCPARRSSRSARTAADPRSGWAPPPARPAPSCSPSTTTGGRRRTRPGGSGTTRRSSMPASAGWTRCRSSGARSTTPGWRTSSSPSSGGRPTWPATGRRRPRWCSSTAATASSRPSADYAGWTPHVAVGGTLAIHDVFPDPADGGRPPYEDIFVPALASGRFRLTSATGSLRVLHPRRLTAGGPLARVAPQPHRADLVRSRTRPPPRRTARIWCDLAPRPRCASLVRFLAWNPRSAVRGGGCCVPGGSVRIWCEL